MGIAMELVLNALTDTLNTFMPIFREFHILEIGLGVVFVLGGLGLLSPILGNSILHSGSNSPIIPRREVKSLPDKGGK